MRPHDGMRIHLPAVFLVHRVRLCVSAEQDSAVIVDLTTARQPGTIDRQELNTKSGQVKGVLHISQDTDHSSINSVDQMELELLAIVQNIFASLMSVNQFLSQISYSVG